MAERPEEEVFDENVHIREEVLAEAYAQAFDTVMGSLEQYYREDELTLALKYGLKGWMIQPNQNLMQAICGGNVSS